MSTWKNILTNPPTLHQCEFGLWSDTVLATDGKDVFIGNVAKEAGGLFFTGRSADCYECEELRSTEYDLTGWQWMPLAAPEKEKTADEMFGELGYSKAERGELIVYDHESHLKAVVVRKQDRTCEAVCNYPSGSKTARMGYGEVLALARLIEEQND